MMLGAPVHFALITQDYIFGGIISSNKRDPHFYTSKHRNVEMIPQNEDMLQRQQNYDNTLLNLLFFKFQVIFFSETRALTIRFLVDNVCIVVAFPPN
jgi:hypothetical protein